MARSGNDRFQYIQDKQDKQEVTSNDRFGVHIGPSYDFSDIQARMSGMRSKPDVPWRLAKDVNATPDVHVFLAYSSP